MKFFTRYNPPPAVPFKCPKGSSKTIQDFKDEADINTLVNRYSETGSFYDPVAVRRDRVPLFADVSYMPDDFLGAVALVEDAKDRFAALSSEIRDRFHNNPYELLAFMQDTGNREEAIKLGLVNAPAPAPANEPPEADDKKSA